MDGKVATDFCRKRKNWSKICSMYSMSQSLNHFVCEHGLHWTDQPNLFIMDRKCQRNVTIRPGLIWPELSSDQMTNVQDEDGDGGER